MPIRTIGDPLSIMAKPIHPTKNVGTALPRNPATMPARTSPTPTNRPARDGASGDAGGADVTFFTIIEPQATIGGLD